MSLPEAVSSILSGRSIVAVPVIFVVGFVSTLQNPCALPLYPAASAACVIRGPEDENNPPSARPRTSFLNASAFVVGMALSIAILGLAAAEAGRAVGIGRWGRWLIALIPLLMGMQRLGWVRFPDFKFKLRKSFRAGLIGAFATGFMLSLVIGACGSAVLASVLAFAAYQRAFAYGGILLFAYGTGAALPLVAVGAAVGRLTDWIGRKGHQEWTEFGLGFMMLCLGLYLFWIA